MGWRKKWQNHECRCHVSKCVHLTLFLVSVQVNSLLFMTRQSLQLCSFMARETKVERKQVCDNNKKNPSISLDYKNFHFSPRNSGKKTVQRVAGKKYPRILFFLNPFSPLLLLLFFYRQQTSSTPLASLDTIGPRRLDISVYGSLANLHPPSPEDRSEQAQGAEVLIPVSYPMALILPSLKIKSLDHTRKRQNEDEEKVGQAAS